MSESDTPRTDSFAREHAHLCEAIGGYVYPRAIELARALERENAALLERAVQAEYFKEVLEKQYAALRLDKKRLEYVRKNFCNAIHHCCRTTGDLWNSDFYGTLDKWIKRDAARQPGGKEGK